jgi:hypothetical protein
LRVGYVLGFKKNCFFVIWSSSHEVHEGFWVKIWSTMLKFMWFWGSGFCEFLLFVCVCVICNKVVRFVRFYNNETLEFCDFYATFSKIFLWILCVCVCVFFDVCFFVLIYVCVFVDVCCVRMFCV